MTKRELQYFDIDATDYSSSLQALVAAQRITYEADKTAKKALLEQLRREQAVRPDEEITGVFYSRWGQLQISVGKKSEAKANGKAKRPSLAEYLEQYPTR